MTLTDEQIQDAVFAVLRRWKDDRAWDRYTRETGPYDVTSLRPEVLEIIRAVLALASPSVQEASTGAAGQGWKDALHDAATSLETISALAGRKTYGDPPIETYMDSFMDVRMYAAARAKVAREALAASPTAPAAVSNEDVQAAPDWHPCHDVDGASCADQDECANGCIRRRTAGVPARYVRKPDADKRIARGDDVAGDAWLDTQTGETVYTVVGFDRNQQPTMIVQDGRAVSTTGVQGRHLTESERMIEAAAAGVGGDER